MSEWRQPGPALDLCAGETLHVGLFSSTPSLLRAVVSAAPVSVPEECARGVCSLPVWCLRLACAGGGVVPVLLAVWQWPPRALERVSETFVSTGAGSVGTCFFLEATELGLSLVRLSVPATSSQTMSRSLVSTAPGANLRAPQPLPVPGHSRKQQNPRNRSRC